MTFLGCPPSPTPAPERDTPFSVTVARHTIQGWGLHVGCSLLPPCCVTWDTGLPSLGRSPPPRHPHVRPPTCWDAMRDRTCTTQTSL